MSKTYILRIYRFKDGKLLKKWSTPDRSLASTVKLQWERDYGDQYYVDIEIVDPRMI